MIEPGPANRYQVDHAERLRRTFHALTGRDLIDPTLLPEAAAEALFHAPFVVLSHNAAADPILTYGNRAAPPTGLNGRACWRKSRPEGLSTTIRGCGSRTPGGGS